MDIPDHQQIASLAYQLWHQRGCPDGSPEIDWEAAERILEAPSGEHYATLVNRSAHLEDRGASAAAATSGVANAPARATSGERRIRRSS